MFRTVPLSIIRSFSLYTQQWYMSYKFADSLWSGSGRKSVLILLASCQKNLYVLLCVQWETPDDGQRNSPKHVEFYSKNKFEKLVYPVGFTYYKNILALLHVGLVEKEDMDIRIGSGWFRMVSSGEFLWQLWWNFRFVEGQGVVPRQRAGNTTIVVRFSARETEFFFSPKRPCLAPVPTHHYTHWAPLAPPCELKRTGCEAGH